MKDIDIAGDLGQKIISTMHDIKWRAEKEYFKTAGFVPSTHIE